MYSMKVRHDRFFALLAALLASFSTLPLFQPYFFASSDGLFHLYRLMEYDRALRDGVLYARWAPDFFLGYGFPLFNYYAPATYYLGEIFHLLGAGYIDSLKLLVAVAMALSGIGAYLYSRAFLSPVASVLAAAVYMYVPYHLVNLYYRGDIAEYLAYTWFPFVLWSLRKVIETRKPVFIAFGGLLYAALILTHNLSAFIFSGFLIIYCLAMLWPQWSGRKLTWTSVASDTLPLVATALVGAGLSTFFWLPALLEKSLVDFDRLLVYFNYHEHFPSIEDLLSTSLVHRYGIVFRNADVFGYKLGVLQTCFLALGITVLVWRWKRLGFKLRAEAVASLLVAAISFFFIFPISLWFWDNAPLLNLTQFPWRFLAFVALPSAVLAGLLAEALPGKLRWALAIVLVPLVIFSSTAGMFPIQSSVSEEDISPMGSVQFELTYGAVGTSAAAEYLPKWVKHRPAISLPALAMALDEGDVPALASDVPGLQAQIIEKKASLAVYKVSSAGGGTIVLNTLYYPGWQAFLDGSRIDIGIDDPSGLIKLAVPGGEHILRVEFVETRLRLLSDGISGLSLAVVLVVIGVFEMKRRLANRGSVELASTTDAESNEIIGSDRAPSLLSSLKHGRSGKEASSEKRTSQSLPQSIRAVRLYVGKCANDITRRAGSDAVVIKVVAVIALIPVFLAAKTAYDSGYVASRVHGSPLVINLDNRIMIEGYKISGVRVGRGTTMRTSQGATLQVSLDWRVLGQDLKAAEYRPFARLTNNFHQTWAYSELPAGPLDAVFTEGETATTVLPLEIPEETPPGVYQIEVGFQASSTDEPLEVTRVYIVPVLPSDSGGRIGPLIVERDANVVEKNTGNARPTRLGNVGMLNVPVNFHNQMALLGYDIVDGESLRSGRPGKPLAIASDQKSWTLAAGDAVHVDLLWQAADKMKDDLTVTARLVGWGQTLWAVRDSEPADGTYPTSFWSKGEVVRDQLNLRIPADTPPGQYALELEVVSSSGPLSIIDQRGVPVGPTLKLGDLRLMPPDNPLALDGAKVQNRLMHQLSSAITLVGYTLGGAEAHPGERVHVELEWLAASRPGSDLKLRLELLDREGRNWPSIDVRPIGDAYPTNLWRAGDVWRGQYDILLPPEIAEGRARILLHLYDAATGQVVGSVDIAEVLVLPRARVFSASPGVSLVREFEGKVKLLGYDIAAGQEKFSGSILVVAPPGGVEVTVYWQAMAEMKSSYKVFAQVLDSSGRLVAQDDSVPNKGESPTTGWVVGEVIADEHRITLPDSLPDGDYSIITGLYDELSGERLQVAGGGDYVALTHLRLARQGSAGP